MATTKNTLLVSPHADEAKVLLDKIRALRLEIPRLVPEVPSQNRKLVNAGVPDPFIESASVAVQSSVRLEQASGVDAVAMRDSFGFALAYDAVVKELQALARSMAYTIRVQRAEAALNAFDVYAFAQRLSGQKDGLELLPHVENMKKKLNHTRQARKASKKPVPATALAPTTSDKK
jgi:hypothetical protein